jgi:Ca2+-binding EF-hand superfamily protein
VSANEIDVFFEQLDKNHNGFLTYKEAHDTLLRLSNRDGKSYSEKDLKAYFARLDLDHDKKLSIREFKDAYISGQFGGNNYVQPQQRPTPTYTNGGDDRIIPAVTGGGGTSNNPDVDAIFFKYDKDRSGFISASEAKALLTELNSRLGRNYGDDELQAFFDKLDINRDGRLSLDEFRQAFNKTGSVTRPASNGNQREIDEIFFKYDKDRSGFISEAEAKALLSELNGRLGRNYGEAELQAFFNKLDINRDGKLSLDEFRQAFNKTGSVARPASGVNQREINEIFAEYDTDRSGFISVSEAEALLLKLNARLGRSYGEDELKVFFNRLDVNRDGKLSIVEFRRAYENL